MVSLPKQRRPNRTRRFSISHRSGLRMHYPLDSVEHREIKHEKYITIPKGRQCTETSVERPFL